jgi:hypothetical protein
MEINLIWKKLQEMRHFFFVKLIKALPNRSSKQIKKLL